MEHFVSPVFPFSVVEPEVADVLAFPFFVVVTVLVFPSVEVADALHAAVEEQAVPVV
ncbi:hypothetical protein D3C71_2210030 [compost metagenome]